MEFEELTPEQQRKAKICKTIDELSKLAKDEGYDLSLDQLDGISGGADWDCDEDSYESYRNCSGYGCEDYGCNSFTCKNANCRVVHCIQYRIG